MCICVYLFMYIHVLDASRAQSIHIWTDHLPWFHLRPPQTGKPSSFAVHRGCRTAKLLLLVPCFTVLLQDRFAFENGGGFTGEDMRWFASVRHLPFTYHCLDQPQRLGELPARFHGEQRVATHSGHTIRWSRPPFSGRGTLGMPGFCGWWDLGMP